MAISNQGSIAIAKARHALEIYHIQSGKSAKPKILHTATVNEGYTKGSDIVYLKWNFTGTHLASADMQGNVTLWDVRALVNQLTLAYTVNLKSSIVFARWLNVEKQAFRIAQGLRKNAQNEPTMVYAPQPYLPIRPYNTLGTNAILIFTADGNVHLLYQYGSGISFRKVTESILQDVHVTHAEWFSDSQNVVFALYYKSRIGSGLAVGKIQIEWSTDSVSLKPRVQDSYFSLGKVVLTHMKLTRVDDNPAICAVVRDGEETIARIYELVDISSDIHPAFNELEQTSMHMGSSTSFEGDWTLHFKSEVKLKGPLASITSDNIFIYTDRTTEARAPDMSIRGDKPSELSQSISPAVEFDASDFPVSCMDLSNNKLLEVYLDHEGQFQLNVGKSSLELSTLGLGLSFQVSKALLAGHCIEDILLFILSSEQPEALASDMFKATQHVLSVRHDLPEKVPLEKIVNTITLSRIYSLQIALFQSFPNYSIATTIGYSMLSLRTTYIALLSSVKNVALASKLWHSSDPTGNEKLGDELHFREGSTILLTGVLRWLMDFITCLVADLLRANQRASATASSSWEEIAKIPSIYSMLFGSMPLGFLRVCLRGAKRASEVCMSDEIMRFDPEGVVSAVAAKIKTVVDRSPVSIDSMLALIEVIDRSNTSLLTSKSLVEKSAYDESVVTKGIVSDHFIPSIKAAVTQVQNDMRIDKAYLFTYDTSWLQIGTHSIDPITGTIQDWGWDIVTRMIIRNVAKDMAIVGGVGTVRHLRQCLRCGSQSELRDPEAFRRYLSMYLETMGIKVGPNDFARGLTSWTVLYVKSCICGGLFVLL